MKKILQFLLLPAALVIAMVAVLIIPNDADRICGIIAYLAVFGPLFVLACIEHKDTLLFLLLVPVFITYFFVRQAWKRLVAYWSMDDLTPAEKQELMKNRFDEPWGIGAW